MQARVGNYNILLASSVVVITALIICVVFYQSYNTKLVRYSALNSKLNKESKRFTRLDDKSLLVAEYKSQFDKYMPVKQYENENRLYWLDSLERIRIKHKIPRLSYTIGLRKPYLYKDGVIKDRGVNVSVSNITLSMRLMHEADLLSVINSIKSIKKSINLISSCNLKRIGATKNIANSKSGPNVSAECNVKWFTFKVS